MTQDEIIRENVRKRLIECRIEAELTQTEVGEIVGKSKNAIASWEQGLSLPSIQALYRLSKYYKKTISYMYGEEDKGGTNEENQENL